jgi:cell division septation protein DedD
VSGRLALLGAGLLLTAAGCSSSAPRPQEGTLAGAAASTAPTSLLRLARGGGPIRAHDGRTLAALPWSSEALPPVAQIVGLTPDDRALVLLDARRGLELLDLSVRRPRLLGGGVAMAVVGPDGTILTIDTARTLTAIGRRAAVRVPRALPGQPSRLHGTLSGRLLAFDGSGPKLRIIGGGQPAAETPLPQGPVAVTMYGELLAVATDSGIVLVEPDRDRPPVFERVRGGTTAAIFSPSGHRLYVGTAERGLIEYDRFGMDEVAAIELPGAVADLRMDREGRWLLVRPARRDSVWVVDLLRRRPVAAIATGWADDLPVVTGDGLVAVRSRDDVALVNVGAPRPVELARIAGGAADLWAVARWSPVQPDAPAPPEPAVAAADSGVTMSPEDAGLEQAIDSVLAAGSVPVEGDAADRGTPAETGPLYLQVSSSRNPEWAKNLGEQLQRQGLAAQVLSPALPDEPYRVVLGPYPTRAAADEAARKLGMPSFVISVGAAPR